ncbi:MAG: thiol reductant ABC exporter subunit CydC [Spirochaetia bacterium]
MATKVLNKKKEKVHSAISIMLRLVYFILPLMPIMLITIVMGVLGFLVAIGITVAGTMGITKILENSGSAQMQDILPIIQILIVFAISRGVLRYLEQYSGHFIAFKLLAFMRNKIYKVLRKLAPAKLDNKQSGHMISLVTSDVELLEVFFAHTIAPIIIAIITSLLLVFFIAQYSLLLAGIALFAYLCIGVVIPCATSIHSRKDGHAYREDVAKINHSFLENLQGMREVILFGQAQARLTLLEEQTNKANMSVKKIKAHHAITKALTETAVLGFSMLMLFAGIFLIIYHGLSFYHFLISIVCLMSSFGPVVTLSNLSNNLLQTLASGERILALLDEEPIIEEQTTGQGIINPSLKIENISFAYAQKTILENISFEVKRGQIIGIMGKSGSGKSTLLKLIMRFYDVQGGKILIDSQPVQSIKTTSLRQNIGYVTQQTYLFDTTIEENLRIAKRDASLKDIQCACEYANIHEFIMNLPQGYETHIGELGEQLSGGEQQRIGLARAFLHDSKIILLDEPTSNLDSLNENMILASLKKHSDNRAIILVSHRPSTLSICDTIYTLESGRFS